jgi:hypothetical protein
MRSGNSVGICVYSGSEPIPESTSTKACVSKPKFSSLLHSAVLGLKAHICVHLDIRMRRVPRQLFALRWRILLFRRLEVLSPFSE